MLELRDGRDLTYVLITHNLSLAWSLERGPERSGQVVSLAGDIVRSKALDFLVDHAEIASAGEDSTEADSEPPEQDRAEEQP